MFTNPSISSTMIEAEVLVVKEQLLTQEVAVVVWARVW